MASTSTPRLVKARESDLTPGGTVYVLGRRAKITSLDLPLVFFQYEGSDLIKHRSFSASPDAFSVISTNPASPHNTEAKAATATNSSPQKEASPRATSEPFPTPESAKNNLLSAFGKRPDKVLFEGLTSQEITTDAKMPASVYLDSCVNCTVTVLNKVSSITLHKCEGVSVRFEATISNTELINCKGCTVVCVQRCLMFTVDQSKDCVIKFPRKTNTCCFVTINTSGTKLVAHEDDKEHETTEIVEERSEEQKDDSQKDKSEQYTTRWDGNKFTPPHVIQREGIGYVTNL